MSFEPVYFDRVYRARLETTWRLDGEEVPRLSLLHSSHGSVFGFAFEHVLVAYHRGVFESQKNSAKGFDLLMHGTTKVECKTVTDNGLRLCESGEIGKGRTIDQDGFRASAREKVFALGRLAGVDRLTVEWVFKRGEAIAAMGPSMSYKRALMLFTPSPATLPEIIVPGEMPLISCAGF